MHTANGWISRTPHVFFCWSTSHAASRADAVGGDAKAAKAAAKAAKKARKLAGSPLECAVFQGHVDFTGQKGFTAAALVETSAHGAPPASSALRATIGERAETPQWAFGGAQVRANFLVRVSAIARRKLGGGGRKPKRRDIYALYFTIPLYCLHTSGRKPKRRSPRTQPTVS